MNWFFEFPKSTFLFSKSPTQKYLYFTVSLTKKKHARILNITHISQLREFSRWNLRPLISRVKIDVSQIFKRRKSKNEENKKISLNIRSLECRQLLAVLWILFVNLGVRSFVCSFMLSRGYRSKKENLRKTAYVFQKERFKQANKREETTCPPMHLRTERIRMSVCVFECCLLWILKVFFWKGKKSI